MMNLFRLPEFMLQLFETPKVAQTPSEIIYSDFTFKVYHYLPKGNLASSIPILIVNSLVNKYYILDLMPGKSYVEYLVSQGLNVYLVDWGEPKISDSGLSLEDYISFFLNSIVKQVLKHSKAKKLSMLGYCMGGTMALIYASLKQQHLQNLVLLATPVDFHNDSLLSLWGSPENFNVDKFINIYGNVPKEILYSTFMMLKPLKNITKYVDLVENIDHPEYIKAFMAFDHWIKDAIPIAGETFRQFIKYGYQENLLVQNKFPLGSRTVNLKNVKCPLLSVVAEHDEIVPLKSSEILVQLVSSKDKELLKVKGGHHGLSIGGSAITIVWPKTVEWLLAHNN
ncbi:MAG: alpha/beta fold hydrolase [Acidobacteria bacterium]|nr:alpha/beta fold hydrolase [Acidobacteriota bacterium]